MSLLREETWPICKTLTQMVLGNIPCESQTEWDALYNRAKDHIKALNNSLKGSCLVGSEPTIADFQLALCLIEMQQFVLDTNFRNSLNNLNKHFKMVCDLPSFKERCGVVRQGKK